MKQIDKYKERFFSLLESKVGDVKPLISEQTGYPPKCPEGQVYNQDIQRCTLPEFVVKGGTIKDYVIKRDGTFVLKTKAPKDNKCFGVPAEKVYYQSKDSTDIAGTEEHLKSQIKTGQGMNMSSLAYEFGQLGCSSRKTPKTEEELDKPGYYLVKGDKGPLVTKIQKLLANAAEGYAHQLIQTGMNKPNFNPFDGVFGSITDRVVREYQKDNNLTSDGKVGKKTWEILKNVKMTHDWDVASQKFLPINNNQTTS